jgi:hypothetical protein
MPSTRHRKADRVGGQGARASVRGNGAAFNPGSPMMGAAHNRCPVYRGNIPLDGAVTLQWFCDLVREVIERHLPVRAVPGPAERELIAGMVSNLSRRCHD